MIQILLQLFGDVPPQVAVFLLSMIPVTELRGALPVALAVYHMSLLSSLIIVIVGNMIPAFCILYIWEKFIEFLEKYWKGLHKIMKKIETRTEGKAKERIRKYGSVALALFVAVPLPGSGVWTGSLIAWLLRMNRIRALISIFAGVIISATIVSIITLSGLKIL